MRLVLCCLFALLIAPATAAPPTLVVTRTASALTTTIATDVNLYLEVRYVSDVPLRLQAEGYAGDARVQHQKMNATAVHPAGNGSALVWIALSAPGAINAVHITAYDADWTPLATLVMPTSLTWSDTISAIPPTPEWAEALMAEETRAIEQQMAASGSDDGGNLLIGGLVMAGTPLYILLQILAAISWTGRWRIAALIPVVPMGLAIGHALFALAAGSNLWPILVILGAPFAVLYLLALMGLRLVAQRAAAA